MWTVPGGVEYALTTALSSITISIAIMLTDRAQPDEAIGSGRRIQAVEASASTSSINNSEGFRLWILRGRSLVSIQVLDTRKILFCRGAGWGCDRLVGCRVPTSSPARS